MSANMLFIVTLNK